MATTSPRPQLPPPHTTPGWADICEEQVRALFDWANNRLDAYVEDHLANMELNLSRHLDPRNLGGDLLHTLSWLDNLIIGQPTAWTPLPSTLRREARFARAVLDPQALNTFLDQTFDHLQTALASRKGRALAAERVAQAKERLAPVRIEVHKRLTEGPKLTQALSGPGAYALVPGFWVASSLIIGDRRREREEVMKEMASRASRLLHTDARYPDLNTGHITRLTAALILACMGAAILPTTAYRVIDIARIHWNHLDAIEHLLLHGDPKDDEDDEDYDEDELAWELALLASGEDDDEDDEDDESDADEPQPRPGLLAIIRALDTDEPL